MKKAESGLAQMPEDGPQRRLRAELLAQRAMTRGLYGQMEEVLALCEQAQQFLDDQAPLVDALLHTAWSFVWLAQGQIGEALASLHEAASTFSRAGIPMASFSLSCLSTSYLCIHSHLQEAEQTLLALARQSQEPSLFAAMLAAAQVALSYEHNDLEHAWELAQQAQHLVRQAGTKLVEDQAKSGRRPRLCCPPFLLFPPTETIPMPGPAPSRICRFAAGWGLVNWTWQPNGVNTPCIMFPLLHHWGKNVSQ